MGKIGPRRLRIATFNIQVLGKAKSGKPEVIAQLAKVIRQYDVVAVQEIRDLSGTAPRRLLAAINDRDGSPYDMLLSERCGREPDDRNSQEQYAFLYDTTTVKALPGDHVFDDSEADLFQREPYLAHFRALHGGFSFVLINIHARPQGAVSEIGALHDVVERARTAFPEEDDFIALGDFNAGCSYASPSQLDALNLRGPSYFWIVPDDSDSNVSTGSACAYDRIVATTTTQAEFTGEWGVDKAFTDKTISDHWPVWAKFSCSENDDGSPASGLLSVNTATTEELQALPGIGPVRAQANVADREANWPFSSVDDLTPVSGIGPAAVDGIRDLVTVE